MEILKQRLAYEWKNIYRSLTAIDMDNKGKVGISEFQGILSKNRVYMTREDLKRITALFSEDYGESLNYVAMS